jgi:type IV pilus assembly protein PilO
MHQAIENILERPTSHKIGIWIATILLILAGFWQFSLSSLIEEREKLDEEVARLDSEILTEKRLAGKLGKAEEKLKDLEARLKGALEQLPDKSEIDNLLEKISNLARESGLDLNLFQRKEENFKDFYAEVPVSVSVTGSYHQVATFFDEVSRLPRIVNINQIEIIDPKPN